MANFLAKLTLRFKEKEDKEAWNIFINRSVNIKGGGVGVIALGRRMEKIEHVGHLTFHVTNGEAEYEALRFELKIEKYCK